MSPLRRIAAPVLAALGLALVGAAVVSTEASAAAPSAQDRTFLVAAHQSNLAEIAAGRAAQQKATTSVVKRHGQQFITDHTRLDGNLTAVAGKLGVTLPGAPTAAQQASLAAVTAQSGAAFDKAWIQQQTTGHLQAKAAGQKELATGSDTSVVALAKAAGPVVQIHLNMLLASGGTPTGVDAGTGGQAASAPAGDRPLGWGLLGLGALLTALVVAVVRPRRGTA